LKLESKVLVAEGKTTDDSFSIECASIDSDVYVWVCEEGSLLSSGILRVAKWQKDGQLKWTECYRGKKGYLLRGLTVDALHGTAAAIFPLTKGQWVPSAVICQIQDGSPRSVNLEVPFPGKTQLLHVDWDGTNWLLSGQEKWNIIKLNDELQRVGVIQREPSRTIDYHLFRGTEGKVYIATITPEGQLKVAELEKSAGTKPAPEQVEKRDLEELSQETIASAYKEYIEGEGKNLLKATDDQLARDIVSGSRESISPLISYYRLLLRDEKWAKKCLSKQIAAIVKGGVGHEHWITEMQLVSYGESAIEPLLRIADTGTPEERQIAVAVLYLVSDLAVTNELIKLLDRPDVRKDSVTCMMICEMAITAGKTEVVDFLIEAATAKSIGKGDFEARQLRNKSRQMFIELTAEYEDTPEDWSERSWNQWWGKRRDTVELVGKSAAELEQERKEFKQRDMLFQKLAKMLEDNQNK